MTKRRQWPVVQLWAAAAICGLTACAIADPHRPQWLEAHGHLAVRSIASTPAGVLGMGDRDVVYRYPGSWNKPWEELMTAPAKQIAGNEQTLWILTNEGAVLRKVDPRAPGEPLTNGGGITRLAVTSAGDVHVLAQNHPQRLIDGRLVDTPCSMREAIALAIGPDGTVVLTLGGALAVESPSGLCQEMPAPFRAVEIAADDVPGGFFDLAAVDTNQRVWLRRQGNWEQMPPPLAYRPGRVPRAKAVVQVAVTAFDVWARTDDGLVFLFSDPR